MDQYGAFLDSASSLALGAVPSDCRDPHSSPPPAGGGKAPSAACDLTDSPPTQADIVREVDLILWALGLESVRRYLHQRFWIDETFNALAAEKLDPLPRLESVAAHSWHVCDTVLLIGAHFPGLNLDRCAVLAVLHDKLELLTGDKNPIGRDGTGRLTHAFNLRRQFAKEQDELVALKRYLGRIPSAIRGTQSEYLSEIIDCVTPEARFVRAVDKLQPLAYIISKKNGDLTDLHLSFTVNYSARAIEFFPALDGYFNELRGRLYRQVARRRGVPVDRLVEGTGGNVRQLELF
jgi:5'-deoxynucleotidase YfbR-like HD superfamily hydrolase